MNFLNYMAKMRDFYFISNLMENFSKKINLFLPIHVPNGNFFHKKPQKLTKYYQTDVISKNHLTEKMENSNHKKFRNYGILNYKTKSVAQL